MAPRINRFRFGVTVALVVLFSGGCSGKNYAVRSNQDIEHLTQVKKVLFISPVDGTLSLDGDKFRKAFLSALRSKMKSFCVESGEIETNKLELDEGQTARKAISAFQPSELLDVNFIPQFTYTGQILYRYGTLRFALTDIKQQRIVWRGEVSSMLDDQPGKIDVAVMEFAERMKQDGVLNDLCAH